VNLTKRVFVLILALSLTVPTHVMVFVLDLPVILKHFHHHQSIESISFIDFVHEHSKTVNHPDREKDHPDHDKLPFQHDQNSDCFKTLLYLKLELATSLTFISPLSTHVKFFSPILFPNSLYKKGIWHPPKFC